MTKAEQTYQRVNELIDGGTAKADAFRQLATEYGQSIDSVRGAYYGHKRTLEGGTATRRRSRKRETTAEDAVASAISALESSVGAIEAEVEMARERAEEAVAEHEAIREASAARIAEIRAKIALLSPDVAKRKTAGGKAGS